METKELLDELFRERKKDRRASLIKTSIIAVGAALYLGATFAVVGLQLKEDVPTEPFAAVVPITGTIGPGNAASYTQLAPVLEKAFSHPLSKGVVLSINSPGGTPVQSSLIHDLILELKAKHKKPVIAVGEDTMASGAYFIAVAADKVVANRSTVTGSIGVISSSFGFNELLGKVGVERRVATAGESKSMLDPFLPASDADKLKQQELLEGIHQHFKDVVITGRGNRLKQDTPGLFEGTVWTGEKAVELGLVDELGSVHSSAAKHLGVEKTVTMQRKKPLLDSVMDSVGVKMSAMLAEASVKGPTIEFKVY